MRSRSFFISTLKEAPSDAEVISHPDRYRDGRGADFFDEMMAKAAAREEGEAAARAANPFGDAWLLPPAVGGWYHG